MGLGTQWPLGRVTHVTSTDLESRSSRGQWSLVQFFLKKVTVSTYFDIFSWDLDTVILRKIHTYDLNRSGVVENCNVFKLQLSKSDGICLKGWWVGNIDGNRASWVSKFRKINQLSYCVTFFYMGFTILSLVWFLTMSRNFLVVL